MKQHQLPKGKPGINYKRGYCVRCDAHKWMQIMRYPNGMRYGQCATCGFTPLTSVNWNQMHD